MVFPEGGGGGGLGGYCVEQLLVTEYRQTRIRSSFPPGKRFLMTFKNTAEGWLTKTAVAGNKIIEGFFLFISGRFGRTSSVTNKTTLFSKS